MRLLDSIAELVAPTRCAGCDFPGTLLCGGCHAALPRIQPAYACPSCGAPYGHLVCTECWRTSLSFERAIALGVLDGGLARGVVLHKDAGERRLGPLFGDMLAERIADEWLEWADAVTWIPATREAVIRRGFDHAHALAVRVSLGISAPLVETLERGKARDQRSLGRAARASNAAGTFVSHCCPPPRVLLVDDVLTTGATLDAAAAVLLDAGASAVRAAVLARAW